MAGHSKWKNIQHRKGAQDAKKGKIFTKMAVEITVSVRQSGSDPETNPRLRLALTKARASNMPRDNIERAIKKGAGDVDASTFSERIYEGYGPGGVAVVIEALTDNLNRTVGDIRSLFTKAGGTLGAENSVGWMFHKKGMIVYERALIKDHDHLFELSLENGADDIKEEEESVEILCAQESFSRLREALERLGYEPAVAEVTRIPENYSQPTSEQTVTLQKLIDALEDLDDVQNVYHNADFAEGAG